MNLKVTYRWSAISLALLFSLYIVGLPIVVSACPMMVKGHKMACCADASHNGLSIQTEENTSCCKVVIAAKPITTEFVSSTLEFVHLSHIEVTPLTPIVNEVILSHSGIFFTNISPVTEHNVKDICILTSSLLI